MTDADAIAAAPTEDPAAGPPAVGVGDAGSLLEVWNDADGVALLRHMTGTADAAKHPFSWRRDTADPALLVLDRALLGVRVAGADPGQLASGVEYLATCVGRLMVRVEMENRAAPDAAVDMAVGLAARLRPLLAVRPADAPAGVSFLLEEGEALLDPRRATDLTPGMEVALDRLRHPEVQDHRPLIPPQPEKKPEKEPEKEPKKREPKMKKKKK